MVIDHEIRRALQEGASYLRPDQVGRLEDFRLDELVAEGKVVETPGGLVWVEEVT